MLNKYAIAHDQTQLQPRLSQSIVTSRENVKSEAGISDAEVNWIYCAYAEACREVEVSFS